MDRDFQYLRKPSYVPNAYRNALKEMTRRRKFREIVDKSVKQLQKFLSDESQARQDFKHNTHLYLPSSFCPALKDPAPEIRLEGPSSEYTFPTFLEVVVELESPFKLGGEPTQTDNEM